MPNKFYVFFIFIIFTSCHNNSDQLITIQNNKIYQRSCKIVYEESKIYIIRTLIQNKTHLVDTLKLVKERDGFYREENRDGSCDIAKNTLILGIVDEQYRYDCVDNTHDILIRKIDDNSYISVEDEYLLSNYRTIYYYTKNFKISRIVEKYGNVTYVFKSDTYKTTTQLNSKIMEDCNNRRNDSLQYQPKYSGKYLPE